MRTNCAVVDASVIVSAFLTPGPARQLLGLAQRGAFTVCLSARLLEEIRRSLSKPKLMTRYGYDIDKAGRFCARLAVGAQVVRELPDIPPICRDPDDDHVIAAALAAGADCIVTGDDDLLALGTHAGIRILTVRQFLDLVSAQ